MKPCGFIQILPTAATNIVGSLGFFRVGRRWLSFTKVLFTWYLGAPDILAEVVAPREGAPVHARGVDERGGDADKDEHGEGDEGDE